MSELIPFPRPPLAVLQTRHRDLKRTRHILLFRLFDGDETVAEQLADADRRLDAIEASAEEGDLPERMSRDQAGVRFRLLKLSAELRGDPDWSPADELARRTSTEGGRG